MIAQNTTTELINEGFNGFKIIQDTLTTCSTLVATLLILYCFCPIVSTVTLLE